MKKLISLFKDTSLYRRIYIVCLFLCCVLFAQIPAYVCLVFLFIWGVALSIYNLIVNRTFLKMHFGIWLVAFIFLTTITLLINITSGAIYNLVYQLNLLICFFVFYGLHTEKAFNFRKELYWVCRFIVYTTTVLGIIGLACLMAGISFEVLWFRFIIYENRFTSLYINPNNLGFISCVGLVSTHMLTKQDFIKLSEKERVSRIWIATSLFINGLSLILCDSNSSLVLMIGYCIFFIAYKMLGKERKFTVSQILIKSVTTLLVGAFIIGAMISVRYICQNGLAQVISTIDDTQITSSTSKNKNNDYSELIDSNSRITFTHENKNIDSGRFVLWEQGLEIYKDHPVFGTGKANIYLYGEEKFPPNGIKFSRGFMELMRPFEVDLHNAYLTLLVSAGALGFIVFAIFGLRFAKHITVHVLKETELTESVFPCMYAFLCAYLFYSIFEKAMMFNMSFTVMYFWLIMGYTACFLNKYEGDHKSSIYILKKRFRKSII